MSEPLTYLTWDEKKVDTLEKQFNDSFDVLKWAYEEYGNELVYACSFGVEGIVLIDMISKVNEAARVLFLDTDLHFDETYKVIEKVKNRYPNLDITMVKPKLTLHEQVKEYGERLWERDPNQCCQIRKIIPLAKHLSSASAWISGIRRQQSPTRQRTNYINKDEKFKTIKICPLIHWTLEEIWMYVNVHELDYNELHDRGYPSIGCAVCTQPTADPNDERSGRWAQFEKTECGLHT